ncbi:hypothetical protein GCM10029964_079350 [Kibdelosporangium lantanae]
MSAAVEWAGEHRRGTAAAVLLGAVLRHGPVARSTIARLTGLSPAAVTRNCAALADLGLLTEATTAIPYQGIGRPHVPLDIDTSRYIVAGLHIAHDFCTLALLDPRGCVRARLEVPHRDPGDPEDVLATAADRLLRLHAEQLPGHVPLGLGVAAGGWVDTEAGVLVEHASLGWQGIRVRDALTARTGLPVRVDSHARALARAEQLFGAAGQRESMVHLFVGNVVDAAIVTGGTPHRGSRSAAGDVAHLAQETRRSRARAGVPAALRRPCPTGPGRGGRTGEAWSTVRPSWTCTPPRWPGPPRPSPCSRSGPGSSDGPPRCCSTSSTRTCSW